MHWDWEMQFSFIKKENMPFWDMEGNCIPHYFREQEKFQMLSLELSPTKVGIQKRQAVTKVAKDVQKLALTHGW